MPICAQALAVIQAGLPDDMEPIQKWQCTDPFDRGDSWEVDANSSTLVICYGAWITNITAETVGRRQRASGCGSNEGVRTCNGRQPRCPPTGRLKCIKIETSDDKLWSN